MRTDDDATGGDISTTPLSPDAEALRRRLPPRAAISVYHRDGTAVVTLAAGERCVVGRAGPADVVIADTSLSRQHARLGFDGERVVVCDLGSTNGTRKNGALQPKQSDVAIGPDDDVLIGAVVAKVALLGRGEARPAGLDGHDAFVVALREEVLRARHFGRVGTMLSIASTDDARHVSSFVADVRRRLRAVDRVAVYAPRVLEVLLPELAGADALVLARSILADNAHLTVGLTGVDGGDSVEAVVDCAHRAQKEARRAPDRLCVSPCPALQTASPTTQPATDVVHENAAMGALFATLKRVAGRADRVLVVGETGAGKEVVARALHARGGRAARPFVSVNCASLPATLLESTLFGHVKGAFTGADRDKKGLFEAADSGTVFRDEIGELPAAAQAALLRVLETRRVAKIGAPEREVDVDVCVVAATHRDLEDMCREGTFRADLWYRLNMLTLKVPPLRQRPEDLRGLAETFLKKADPERRLRGFADEALRLLAAYDWPGNVRELKNAVDRAALLATGRVVEADDLPDAVRAADRRPPARATTTSTFTMPVLGSPPKSPAPSEAAVATGDYRAQLRAAEARVLLAALERNDGVQTAAAKELDMPIRTFVHRLKTVGIKRRDGAFVFVPDEDM